MSHRSGPRCPLHHGKCNQELATGRAVADDVDEAGLREDGMQQPGPRPAGDVVDEAALALRRDAAVEEAAEAAKLQQPAAGS